MYGSGGSGKLSRSPYVGRVTGEATELVAANSPVGSVALDDVIVRSTSITEDDGDITAGQAINGKTSPDLELGDYDVTVRNYGPRVDTDATCSLHVHVCATA